MRHTALRADLLMLLTAAIWGFSFVAQRLGMDAIGPFLYTGLRFLLATLALLLVLPLLRGRAQRPAMERSLLLSGGLMGLVLALGINLQQVGLLFTSVTNAGFITGLYVIVVPLLGLLLGQRTGLGIWLGASLAVIGMFLLSVGDGFSVAAGDWLQLIGAFVWGVHVLLVGAFARRHNPLHLAVVQFAVCALISLLLAVALEDIRWGAILAAAPAILYGGLFGVAVGFTLQVVAQQDAIASHAAIILSLEAVFAAIAGAWLLGETLHLKGYLGCALMFCGMLLAQLWPRPASVLKAS
ncbi:MAG: DMT family transporter [Gammaproteobacteria bacterium]|jgi:drug/metabolite transporter (DMT)-like permease|nr:DMT family transporter [Gammaproteobacteria bacterium]MBU1489938.1 DMT family transporter [Gammaproteobacteria bacterium]MBU2064873.1 DMT family transporter [Gammaproteobacteria bacterium]MBU2324371.1 DMT family transporter [Gammaproteobacteria bacterium]